jgi:cell division protein FtsB
MGNFIPVNATLDVVKKIWPHLKNKYAITSLAFVVWMLFLDRNDLISQFTYRSELHKLLADKEYYLSEIERNKKDMHELMSDLEHMEKFARERYLMKKDDEEIFLILPEKKDEATAYEE